MTYRVTGYIGPSSLKAWEPNSPENIHLREQYRRNHPEVVSGAAFEAGRQARCDGLPITGCPYIDSSDEATEWRAGWFEAKAALAALGLAA